GCTRFVRPFPARRSSDLGSCCLTCFLPRGAPDACSALIRLITSSAARVTSILLHHLPHVGRLVVSVATRIAFYSPLAYNHSAVRSEEHTSELQSRENLVC